MTDLREQLAVMVQNKMADHLRVEPDDAKAYPDAEFYEIMGTGPASYAISDAVLSLVIEKCARVAESFDPPRFDSLPAFKVRLAAAIRKLSEKP